MCTSLNHWHWYLLLNKGYSYSHNSDHPQQRAMKGPQLSTVPWHACICTTQSGTVGVDMHRVGLYTANTQQVFPTSTSKVYGHVLLLFKCEGQWNTITAHMRTRAQLLPHRKRAVYAQVHRNHAWDDFLKRTWAQRACVYTQQVNWTLESTAPGSGPVVWKHP